MKSRKRTIILGDIHGCYKELKKLLKKINYSEEHDRLISVGDLVHKGPLSSKVLEFFYKNNLEVVMGNHDWAFLEALQENRPMYKEAQRILERTNISKEKLIKWMQGFPFYIKDESFIVVHGCFDPSKSKYSLTTRQDMISGRYYDSKKQKVLCKTQYPLPDHINPWYRVYPEKKNKRLIIFGHWAQPNTRSFNNFRCIDTGCCYGGMLSCLIVENDSIVSTTSQQPKQFNY